MTAMHAVKIPATCLFIFSSLILVSIADYTGPVPVLFIFLQYHEFRGFRRGLKVFRRLIVTRLHACWVVALGLEAELQGTAT